MNVIAEGIETADIDKELRLLNSDYAQGYLYSKPLSEDKFIALLKSDKNVMFPEELKIEHAKIV